MIQPEYYTVDLPGKLNYAPGTSVEVRKITPFEQKKFYSQMVNAQDDESRDKIFYEFVKGLVKTTNMEFEDIYYPDYMFLLYQIREVTYKLFPLKLYFTCEDCGKKQSVEIKVDELQIESLDGKLKDTIQLETLGEAKIRFKKVKDDKIVTEFLNRMEEDPTDIFMRILATELLLLDNWKPLEETWELAKSGEITSQDIATIENFIADNNWGIKEEITHRCVQCGKEVAENYSIDPASFFSVNND